MNNKLSILCKIFYIAVTLFGIFFVVSDKNLTFGIFIIFIGITASLIDICLEVCYRIKRIESARKAKGE